MTTKNKKVERLLTLARLNLSELESTIYSDSNDKL